jgi:hypothetical protein
MTALQGETLKEAIGEALNPQQVSHLSSFALDILTPNGGENKVPSDLSCEQLRTFVAAQTGSLLVEDATNNQRQLIPEHVPAMQTVM